MSKKLAGKNIHKMRVLHDLSQESLAKAVGVKRCGVANWENGRYYPSEQAVDRMAQLFKVDRDYLLGEKSLRYELSNVLWKVGRPRQSGQYLVYAECENVERRGYHLLKYEKAGGRWLEEQSVYRDGKQIYFFDDFEGRVLQYTAFPPSDCEVMDKSGGRKRYEQ